MALTWSLMGVMIPLMVWVCTHRAWRLGVSWCMSGLAVAQVSTSRRRSNTTAAGMDSVPHGWSSCMVPSAWTTWGMDVLGRTTRRVSVPLPREADNCSTLLFAFPPGQQYEYYNLVLPAAVAGTVYGSTRSAVDVLVARHVLDHDLLREQEAQPTSTVGSTDLIHKVAEMNMKRTAVEDLKLTCCHDDLGNVSARS
mmetsp:Transcript_81181/g.206273  ORF Transcript_81181/g.206273 Transcript_81181/m.206273 type:complete len:196 (+) Transcript_81181:135-722(+)